MKKVIMYETNGKRFDKYSDAEEYEKLCERVNDIMKQLLPRTDKIEWEQDYNKHNIDTLNISYKELLSIIYDKFPQLKNFNCVDAQNLKIALSRVDDIEKYPILHNAMYRFSCIDFESGFEFSQPYYVKHQKEFFNLLKYYKNKL